MVNLSNKGQLNRFEIYLNYGASYNEAVLNELYLPIIGLIPVAIYRYLYEQASLAKYTSMNVREHDRLCSNLEISWDQFLEARHKLEAIGLIKSYSQINIDGKMMIYLVDSTLTYADFITSPKLNELLKNSLDDFGYKQLVYKFNNFVVKSDFVDESVNLEWLINQKQIVISDCLDFNALYTKLLNELHLNVCMSEVAKSKLLSYYKNFNFTLDDVYVCVKNSIVLDKSKSFYNVSYDILVMNLERQRLLLDNSQAPEIVAKINRNFEIFNYGADVNQFNYVMNDYRLLSSENYLLSVTKEDLDVKTTRLLSTLRSKYFFADPLINVLIDYALYRNAGRLEPRYIQKVAQSINNLGIDSLEGVIVYLQNVSAGKKPSSQVFAYNKKAKSMPSIDLSASQTDIMGQEKAPAKKPSRKAKKDAEATTSKQLDLSFLD